MSRTGPKGTFVPMPSISEAWFRSRDVSNPSESLGGIAKQSSKSTRSTLPSSSSDETGADASRKGPSLSLTIFIMWRNSKKVMTPLRLASAMQKAMCARKSFSKVMPSIFRAWLTFRSSRVPKPSLSSSSKTPLKSCTSEEEKPNLLMSRSSRMFWAFRMCSRRWWHTRRTSAYVKSSTPSGSRLSRIRPTSSRTRRALASLRAWSLVTAALAAAFSAEGTGGAGICFMMPVTSMSSRRPGTDTRCSSGVAPCWQMRFLNSSSKVRSVCLSYIARMDPTRSKKAAKLACPTSLSMEVTCRCSVDERGTTPSSLNSWKTSCPSNEPLWSASTLVNSSSSATSSCL
mmetsp:Transcript_3984/g.9253  ORF Transcript_3984/g.9253 Transcript_3984/m.9253 type:complete len:344 (+) Transcript_3984:96-1127(+)